jgi:hypothetical protein
MKTSEAVEFFGSQRAIAIALRIKQPSVCKWGESIPHLRQLQIESLSGGALKAEKGILPRKAQSKSSKAA